MAKKPKVCIIGAECWGSAISTAVCKNVLNGEFDSRVHIYVYDELVRSSYLSEVMNERHENIKYLPGIKLDDNLVAVNDLVEAAKEADILIFATTNSFIKPYCNILAGKLKSSAYAVSLIKGLEHIRDGEIDLHSHAISKQLKIPCYSVMSANSAMEMAQGKLCELTIGCNRKTHAQELAILFETENCKVFSIDDVDGVELCNTLKDLVALSAGFIDGLRLGENARVTCLHLGLKEMIRFITAFNPSTKLTTFFESCGIANSVASSYADKNVTFAKTFVTSRKTVQEIEANLLNGRKLLGPVIAGEIFVFLEKENKHNQYPLFSILHRICQNEVPPEAIVDILRTHPDLSNSSITRLQKEVYSVPISNLDNAFENLDTVPEHKPRLLETVINKSAINGFYENEESAPDSFNRFIKIPTTNVELTEFLEQCEKSTVVTAIADIDTSQPSAANVEYSFEIGSDDNKPDIYLKLQEITPPMPIEKPSDAFTENEQVQWFTPEEKNKHKLCDAVGITNLNSEYQSSNDKVSGEYFSIRRQPAEVAQSDSSNKSDEGNSLPAGGLANVGSSNDKFKTLNVRVKAKKDEPMSVVKKEPVKVPQNTANNPSTNLNVRRADKTKSNASEKTTASETIEDDPESNAPMAKENRSDELKENTELLYQKDLVKNVQPNLARLVDLLKMRKSKNLKKQQLNSDQLNESTKTKKTIDQGSSRNVFPISQGGYTVDYLKVLRHKTEPVPLQFSKTNNAYHPIDPSLSLKSKDQINGMFKTIEGDQTKVFAENSNTSAEMKERLAVVPPVLTMSGDNFEKQKKLKIAQEFLDKQASYINNLVQEAESTENILGAKKATETVFSKLEDANNWQLETAKQEESKVLDQPELIAFEQKQTVDEKGKNIVLDETKIQEILANNVGNWGEENPNQQLSSLEELERTEAKLEEDIIRAFQNPNNDFQKILQSETRCSDERIEGKSKLMEDTNSSALNKKNPNHGLEDPNLRFYHGKNDGEQGPEWDWLLDSTEFDEDMKKTKQLNVEGQSQEIDDQEPFRSKQCWEPAMDELWNQPDSSASLSNSQSIEAKHPKAKELPINLLVNELGELPDQKQKALQIEDKQSGELAEQKTIMLQSERNELPRKDFNDAKSGGEAEMPEKFKGGKISGYGYETTSYISDKPQYDPIPLEFRGEESKMNALNKGIVSDLNAETDGAIKEVENWKMTSGKSSDATTAEVVDAIFEMDTKSEAKESKLNADDVELNLERDLQQGLKASELDSEDYERILLDLDRKQNIIAEPAISELNTDEIEAISKEYHNNKLLDASAFDPTSGELTVEELLLEDDHFKAILDGEEFKMDSANEVANVEEKSKHEFDPNDRRIQTLMTKGLQREAKESSVDYHGDDPYINDKHKYRSVESSDHRHKEHKMRKKVLVRPSFHPPINPRVRIPRPPFDVRDHEYHTVNYRPPPDLMRHTALPPHRVSVPYQVKQVAAASNVVKLPRPVLRLPSSVMRSSVLAVEVGLFAAFFTRYRGGCK